MTTKMSRGCKAVPASASGLRAADPHDLVNSVCLPCGHGLLCFTTRKGLHPAGGRVCVDPVASGQDECTAKLIGILWARGHGVWVCLRPGQTRMF